MSPNSHHEDVSTEISTSRLQASHVPRCTIYTAGFHQCLTNVSSFMTNTSSSEGDSQVSKLKVCLDGHFTNSSRQGHGKDLQLHTVNTSTISYPDSPPVSEQMTPPHSPFYLSPSLSPSPSHSTPGPLPSVSCEPSFSHTASLYALDTYQRSPSSSSLTTSFSSLSHLTTSQSCSSVMRHAVPNPTSSTWRPWN